MLIAGGGRGAVDGHRDLGLLEGGLYRPRAMPATAHAALVRICFSMGFSPKKSTTECITVISVVPT